MSTFAAADTFVAPTVCHDDPSDDTNAVTVDPARASFSQAGGDCREPVMYLVAVPVDARDVNSMSPVGRTSRITFAAFEAADSRIITPAFANMFVLERVTS